MASERCSTVKCCCWLLALIVGSAVGTAVAADIKPAAATAAPISYFKDIRPIFQVNCQGCHQPAKAMGAYVMTDFQHMLKGGESETPAIVPGKPDDSNLVALITPDKGKAEMPKDKSPLAEPDLKRIRQWIAEGAKNDTPASVGTVIDLEHPPVYEALPVLTSVDFAPDDSLLAVSGYHEVLLHKADGAGLVARLIGQSERIESAVFSPDGKLLAVSGGSSGRLGEIQIWDVASRKLKLAVAVSYDTIYGASWSPDGTKLAFGCADNTVRAIDTAIGKQVLYSGAHSDWVLDTAFSRDGKYLISVSRDRSAKLIEVATQRFVDNITSITPGALKGGLQAIDRHPMKDDLLLGGADGVPKTYQMIRTRARMIGDDFNMIKAYEGMPGRIYDVQFSPDGSRFAAASSLDGGGDVRIYETVSGKLLHSIEGRSGGVFSITFSANGRMLASAGFDGLVRLIDVESGKVTKTFPPVTVTAPKVAAVGR